MITANGPKYDFTQVDFSSNGVKLIGVPLDQSTEENYAKADILVGIPNGNTDFTTFSLTPDKEGTLKFRHAGTKITLVLKAGANTKDTDLQGAKVTAINFPTVGVINPITYTGEGGFFNYVWWNEVVKTMLTKLRKTSTKMSMDKQIMTVATTARKSS